MNEITLRPYQKELIHEVRLGLAKHRRVIMQAPTGSGKCFCAGTQILMFNGSIKNVEDITEKDILLAPDGTPRQVSGIASGEEEMFRVSSPYDNNVMTVNKSHILYVWDTNNFYFTTITIAEYLQCSDAKKATYKLVKVNDIPNSYKKIYRIVERFRVESVGIGKYYGFAVDKDHLFLLANLTIVHNTVIFSSIAKQSQAKDSKILIISSRTRMLGQNGGTLESVGLKVAYINPKTSHIPKLNVVAAMAQTLRNRVKNPDWAEYVKTFNIVIIDECHETVADYIFDYISPNCYVIGCTATPHRYSKQKQLGKQYNAIVSVIDVADLINLHYLTKARHFALPAPKLDDVQVDKYSGDFNQKALARVFESKQVYTGVVAEYKRLTPNKKAICFCVSSVQAIDITKEFNEQGISAKYVLSGSFDSDETYSDEQAVVFEEFAQNKFKVLVNVGMAVSSFDCPDIEVCILNFSTISITKYLQAIGRGARIFPQKEEFFILDFGDNIKRHGLYEEPRTWNLWHDEGTSAGLQQSKLCDPDKKDINGLEGCGRLVPISCKVCPACGRVFVTEKHEYQLYLEEIKRNVEDIPEDELTIGQWAVRKKTEGWDTNRILVQICLANVPYEKKAFKEAAEALKLKPTYWYFFNDKIWKNVKKKGE